jgi:hypothetical protein
VFGSAARNRLRVVVEAAQAALPGGVIAAPVPTAAGAGAVAEDGGVPPVAEPGTPLVTSIGSRVTGADGSFEVEYEDAEFQVVGAPLAPKGSIRAASAL